MGPPVPIPPPSNPNDVDIEVDVEAEAKTKNQAQKRKWKLLSIDEQQKAIETLIDESEDLVQSAAIELEDARELVRKAGLSIENCTPTTATPVVAANMSVLPGATTGGHSNTDHVVLQTGDHVTDRLEELKRNMWLRAQQQQRNPELSLQKWDKPREVGGRRRRIARENPDAPIEPPLSGYIIFLGQMTTKIRHDRPNARHNQAEVMPEISKMWRMAMSVIEQKFYNDFTDQIRKEFKKQHMQYRATGSFTPSDTFERKGNFWTHKRAHEKNTLERELDGYETVFFPPRPPEYDEAYYKRERESIKRRRLREKKRVSNGPDDEEEDEDGDLSDA